MFFILPVGVDYRARRYPVVTFSLMGANVVVYLISLVYFFSSGASAQETEQLTWWEKTFWLIPSESVWYTYLTCLFVHGGLLHLLGNMIYLFLFGSCVEDVLGRWRYVIFYLVGGLASNFAHIAFTPDHFASDIALGGASGAISACMGGFVLLFHRTRVEFKYFFFLLFRLWSGEFHLPAWLVLSFWFLKDLALAVLSYAGDGDGGGVAFGAHVGGFLGGLAMVLACKPFLHREDEMPVKPAAPVVRIARPRNEPAVFVLEGETQTGPYPVSKVLEMVDLGTLSADAYFWREGMEDWRSVAELRDWQ
jgi:membrane associated rhomboid family serine protease